MATVAEIIQKPCLCAWINVLGDFVAPFTALLDSMIAVLQGIQATLALAPTNVTDQLKKIGYEAQLAVMEATLGTIEAPLALVINYSRAFSDCDPVNTITKVGNDIRDFVLGDLQEERYRIQKLSDAIDRDNLQSEQIDLWIAVLTEIKNAIELCGNEE